MRWPMTRRAVAALVILGACTVPGILGGAGCAAPTFDFSEKWQTPKRGMVVSEHPLATAAGVKMLESGGNAADAAVATALALAVVYPQAGNLGGGGFALWVAHDTDENPTAYDFRETWGRGRKRLPHFIETPDSPRRFPTNSRDAAAALATQAR